jgi:phosphoesterase RecJ-like protein
MSSPQTTASDLTAVADAIRDHEHFIITTHENPDGDALGSLLAAKLALDCANESRIADPEVLGRVPLSIDVDHHHDNTRFGQINLIVPDASSTGEVLRDLFAALDVELTSDIAEALYIALVTDTGRFQYTNTTPKALRLAAELVEAGADVHRIFQGVYESVQFAKLKLLARALERAQVYEGGRIVVSYLLRTDFADVGAAEPYSEGIIDYLRAVEGADMAVLIREPPRQTGPSRRVSLRASVDELDVSAIARKSGGGGHRQAAGFSSELSIEEITEFVRREFLASARA